MLTMLIIVIVNIMRMRFLHHTVTIRFTTIKIILIYIIMKMKDQHHDDGLIDFSHICCVVIDCPALPYDGNLTKTMMMVFDDCYC